MIFASRNNAQQIPNLRAPFPSLTLSFLLTTGLLGVLVVYLGRIETELTLFGQFVGGTLHWCTLCALSWRCTQRPYCHLVICTDC
jgi:hypothetical protein